MAYRTSLAHQGIDGQVQFFLASRQKGTANPCSAGAFPFVTGQMTNEVILHVLSLGSPYRCTMSVSPGQSDDFPRGRVHDLLDYQKVSYRTPHAAQNSS